MADYHERFGKVMPYTSDDGAEHPASFWCLDTVTVAINNNYLGLGFIGYHSKEAYNANRQPIAGAQRFYSVEGKTPFTSLVGQAVTLPFGDQTPRGVTILIMAWEVALAAKEVGEPPEAGEPDERVSFFDGAADAV